MRVLYLNPFSQEVSGPDESLRTLLRGWFPWGVEAHVVLPAPGPQVERYQALGAAVHFAPLAVLRRDLSPTAALYPLRLLAAAAAVRAHRASGRRRADPHQHGGAARGGARGTALGIPHVLHYRGNTLDARMVFDALTAVWTATADHVYCISRATAGVFERRGRTAKVEVLYNPVDVARFRAAARPARCARRSVPGRPSARRNGRPHSPTQGSRDISARRGAGRRRAPNSISSSSGPRRRRSSTIRAPAAAWSRELGLGGRVTFAGARRDMPGGDGGAGPVRAELAPRRVRPRRRRGDGGRAGRWSSATRGRRPSWSKTARYGLSRAPGRSGRLRATSCGRLLARPDAGGGDGARGRRPGASCSSRARPPCASGVLRAR